MLRHTPDLDGMLFIETPRLRTIVSRAFDISEVCNNKNINIQCWD